MTLDLNPNDMSHVVAADHIFFSAPEIKRGIWPFMVMAGLFRVMPRRIGLDFMRPAMPALAVHDLLQLPGHFFRAPFPDRLFHLPPEFPLPELIGQRSPGIELGVQVAELIVRQFMGENES